MPRYLLPAGLVLATALLPAPLGAQVLVRETTQGTNRICTYGSTTITPARPQRARDQLRVQIGLGEPCPYHVPLSVLRGARQRPAPPMPSLATLAGTEQRGSTRICVYRYLDREYRRPAPRDGACALTPHLQ